MYDRFGFIQEHTRVFAWTQKDSFDESFMVNLWSIVCFAQKFRNHAPIT